MLGIPMQPPPNRPWLTEEDSAKRMHAAMGLHYMALTTEEILQRRFIAIRLADGGSDNTVYDTRAEAIRHQTFGDQNRYLYLVLPLDRPPVEACDTLLWYGRRAYDAGYRPATSHEGAGLLLPLRQENLTADIMLYDDNGRPVRL